MRGPAFTQSDRCRFIILAYSYLCDIAFVGDYAEPTDIPGCDAALICRQATTACNSVEDNAPEGWKQWSNIPRRKCGR